VLAAGRAEKVPDVEPLIAGAIELQQPLDVRDRRPPRRGRVAAVIKQSVIAVAFVPQPQAPNAARAAPEDVGGLQPGELPTESSQDDLLDLHGALHGAEGIGHGHLLGDQFCPSARLARSFHVALGSGHIMCSLQSCAFLLTGSDPATRVSPLSVLVPQTGLRHPGEEHEHPLLPGAIHRHRERGDPEELSTTTPISWRRDDETR